MAAAGLLLLVAGCHLPGSSSAAGPSQSATLTVAATPGVPDAPLYIGIRDGLFREAGLNIRVRSYSSLQDALSGLQSGSADIAFGDYADMFYAKEHRSSSHLAVVADGYDCAPNVMMVLALPGSGINSPLDLAGKTIGTVTPGMMPISTGRPRPYSLETVAAWSALSNQNVDPTKIHWVPMAAQKLITALYIRQVNAILVTEPYLFQAEQSLGAVPVLDACTGATANLPLDGYFSTSTFAKQHTAALTAFRSALAKAQADGTMAAPLQAVLKTNAKMSPQTAALVTVGTYPTALEAANLQRVANLMFFYNMLGSPLSVTGMVAPSQSH